MNYGALRQYFFSRLAPTYAQGELQAVYSWCGYEIEDLQRTRLYSLNLEEVPSRQLTLWQNAIERLAAGEPVQYVFGRTEFFGLSIRCDARALIPRPETEELCALVVERFAGTSVVDACCGGGCIALALAGRLRVSATGFDASSQAVGLARENAAQLGLSVAFEVGAVESADAFFTEGATVVCNPPYIPAELSDTLHPRVVKYEPTMALFAPAGDPFYFFRTVTEKARRCTQVFFETHADSPSPLVVELANIWDGKVLVHNDLGGRPRFLELSR